MRRSDTWLFLLDFYPGVVRDLPVVCPLARRAAAEARLRDLTNEELAAVYRSDVFLAAKLVSVANAPFFNMTHTPCATVISAMERVGPAYALALLRMSKCVEDSQQLAHLETYWFHSALTAWFAEQIAMEARSPAVGAEAMYWIALVHDIGMLVEMDYDRGQMGAVVGALPHELEDHGRHCETGRRLADHWHFPACAKAVIRSHHSPDAQAGPAETFALAVLRVAHALAEGLGAQEFDEVPELASALGQAGLSRRQLAELFAKRPDAAARLHRSMLPVG